MKFCLFVVTIIFTSLLACKKNVTSVKVIKNKIHLGDVRSFDQKMATFEIVNVGNKSFKIEEIQTDCKCTVVEYREREILPQDTGNITLSYTGEIPGFFDQTAIVKSKGLDKDYLLIIQGNIVK